MTVTACFHAGLSPSTHLRAASSTPPQPVIVSINAALSVTSSTSLRDGIPLRVRAEGLAMDMKVQGALHGWARTNVGSWLAYVSFTIPTGNGMGQLDVRQWCPSDAITPLQ